MVYSAGLNESLADNGPFTVFVPTNEAFAKLPVRLVANATNATSNVEANLLKNHWVKGVAITLDDLEPTDKVVKSVSGSNLRINVYRRSDFYKVQYFMEYFTEETDIMDLHFQGRD